MYVNKNNIQTTAPIWMSCLFLGSLLSRQSLFKRKLKKKIKIGRSEVYRVSFYLLLKVKLADFNYTFLFR